MLEGEQMGGSIVSNDFNEMWLKPALLQTVKGSLHDLFTLAQKVSQSKTKPRLFQYCGTEDFLYKDNLRLRDFIRPLGFDYTYEETPGDHSWVYWDRIIQKVLAWLG